MAENEKSNVKLGLFLLAGLFVLVLTLYMIGRNQNLFGSNFEVKARFKNINGLTSGNNIRFSGIQVGTVKRISLVNDTIIEVTMLIDNKMKSFIHKNALASIGTEGLMGNKIINILPGRDGVPLVQEGDVLPVQKPLSTDELLQTFDKTNNNIAEISEELKMAIHRVNHSKALWGVLDDGSLASEIKSSLQHISQASASANDMVKDLGSIIGNVKNGKGSVGALLTDTSFANNLQDAVAKIKLVGEKAAGLADQLNGMADNIQNNIQNGNGPLHALLNDSTMTSKLTLSLNNVQEGTRAFSQDMEALKHNFLLRGYFRKQEKKQRKQLNDSIGRATN